MNSTQIYIAISIVALALIAVFMFVAFKHRKVQRLTPLAGLGFGCILAGMFFGEEKVIGYSLLGIGVVLAVIDIVKRPKIT
jgi:uncharacterized membrane protein